LSFPSYPIRVRVFCFLKFHRSIMANAQPNSYFVPGFGISRPVIQNEIRYHCGPDAIVRPYTHQVCFFPSLQQSIKYGRSPPGTTRGRVHFRGPKKFNTEHSFPSHLSNSDKSFYFKKSVLTSHFPGSRRLPSNHNRSTINQSTFHPLRTPLVTSLNQSICPVTTLSRWH